MWIGQFSLVVLFHMMIQGSRLLPPSDAAVFNRELPLSLKREKREHGQHAGDFMAGLRNGTLSLLVTCPNVTTKVAGKRSPPVWPGEKAGLVSSQSIFATLSAVTYHLLQPWALY